MDSYFAASEALRRTGAVLRERRTAIDPTTASIGLYSRLPSRIGHHVTQEEAAEALGISRVWYSRIESGTVPKISRALARRIKETFAVPIFLSYTDPESADVKRTALEAFAGLRDLSRRISNASSLAEAAVNGAETLQQIVGSDCAAIASLLTEDGIEGSAAGPRARYWTDLSNEIVLEAHAPRLLEGQTATAQYVPLVDEVAQAVATMSFERNDGECEYDYECDVDRWRRFNGDLRVRSAIIVPIFSESEFRGLIATGWTMPHAIDEITGAVAETVCGLVELSAKSPEK